MCIRDRRQTTSRATKTKRQLNRPNAGMSRSHHGFSQQPNLRLVHFFPRVRSRCPWGVCVKTRTDVYKRQVERIPTPVEGSTTRILVKLGTIWAGKDKTVRCSATETPVLNRVTIYLGVEADQQLGGQQFPSPITIINNRRLNLQRQPGP